MVQVLIDLEREEVLETEEEVSGIVSIFFEKLLFIRRIPKNRKKIAISRN